MTIKTCDICGIEIDEDYTRYHYAYDLTFEGQKPHQTRDAGNGMKISTLVCYTEPRRYHLNLCSRCGSAFEKVIGDTIEKLKKVNEMNMESLTELMKNAVIKESAKIDNTLFLMDWAEWNRNHPEAPISYDDATRTYSIGTVGEVNGEDSV